MKMNSIPAVPIGESWAGNNNRLKQLFTYLTGYYIMPAASRKDIIPEKVK
jgi:hypothetical protein